MKIDFKKHLLPFVSAFLIFLAVIAAYNSYEIQGKQIQSHDGTSYEGAAEEYYQYLDKGQEILWSGSVFSGMPLFQTAYRVQENLIKTISYYMSFLPASSGLMFALMVGFFIALMFFEIDWKVAIIGAIGFGLSTWFLLSLEASHNTKIAALAYVAPMLGALYFAYRKKLLLGAVFVAFFVSLNVTSNHYQITYYSLFFIAIIVIGEFIFSLKNKDILGFFKKSVVILLFAILGVLPNITELWSTYDYASETMRSGKSELTKPEAEVSTGLDKDYAMRWSYGKFETLNLLIPGLYAGGYHPDSNSKTVKALVSKGISKKQALEYAKGVPMYYGTQPFTSGPTYLGVVFFLLFGLLFFNEKSSLKWVLLAGAIVAIFFAWGENFWTWNSVFFNHVPMFNKFRSPSMWLGITTIAVGIGAAKSLSNLITQDYDKAKMIKNLYYVSGALGAVILFVYMFGSSMLDFAGPNDAQLSQGGFPLDAIIDDRKSLLSSDAMRALFLLILASGAIWLYLKEKVFKLNTFILAIGVLVLFDMWTVGKRYFNEDDFVKVRKNESGIVATAADKQIEQDKTYFRVFNTTVSSFNDNSTSYRFHSVGGYSAAKLYRYQDIIDLFLSKGNMQVFNMLNTKYFIQGDPGKEVANVNNVANGPVWFVDEIKWAANADEEVKFMEDFDSKKTAIIDARFKDKIGGWAIGNSANNTEILLKEYNPDKMTYTSNSAADGFAVFSEIWYKGNEDWIAYIDGQKVDMLRVNYLLRGLKVPSGAHEIVFEFKPKAHYTGKNIALASSILLLLLIVGVLVYEFKPAKM